jgi:hypothetical protein
MDPSPGLLAESRSYASIEQVIQSRRARHARARLDPAAILQARAVGSRTPRAESTAQATARKARDGMAPTGYFSNPPDTLTRLLSIGSAEVRTGSNSMHEGKT